MEKENHTAVEKENYTAYDLEKEEPRDPARSEIPPKDKGNTDQGKHSPAGDKTDNADNADNAETGNSDPGRKEIERMIDEMGAEKVLEIIRGNRNAAIRQIMKEMEEESDCPMQSGTSATSRHNSIFDLASMA